MFAMASVLDLSFYSQISRWIKTADVARLEHAVYMGKGAHMRGREAIQLTLRN